MKDNTKRFSDRVDNYKKYRPSYPKELINYINEHFQTLKLDVIADIGSGTGKFTELLLPICNKVIAIEPNNEMRVSAENNLCKYKNYQSISGTAEDTKLPDNSIDLITVAQAFHWFDLDKTKNEFQRIIRKNGKVLIIANMRIFNTPFLEAYENALNELIFEYKEVNHYRITSDVINNFFTSDYEKKIFSYSQTFDWEGLIGRLCSSSYTPKIDTEEYKKLENRIKEIYEKYSENGTIMFNYESIIQSGKIN